MCTQPGREFGAILIRRLIVAAIFACALWVSPAICSAQTAATNAALDPPTINAKPAPVYEHAPESIYSVDGSQTVSFVHGTEPLGDGRFKVAGLSPAKGATIGITAATASGFLPAGIDVEITITFHKKSTSSVHPFVQTVTNVPWDAGAKQFVISNDVLKKLAGKLEDAINFTMRGGFGPDHPVPVPEPASFRVTPSIAPAVLAAAFLVVRDVPVSGKIHVTLTEGDQTERKPISGAQPAAVPGAGMPAPALKEDGVGDLEALPKPGKRPKRD